MAIIIRPNSGINNAMAGLAAGFGQGMQLGLQQEKLRMEQERINAILAREERQAILAEAADRRAETAANQQTQLFNLGMEQRQADAEAGGYLAAAQQNQAMLLNPSLMPEPEKTARLPEQAGFEQSNQMTGERMQPYNFAASFNQMMGGLEKKAAYQAVRARYDQNMTAAAKLAGYMSPEMRGMYMRETQTRNLLMADDAARQAFNSSVADLQARGAFQVLDPQGQPVDDPQVAASVKLLLEQAQNGQVPLTQVQARLDQILESVGRNNLKARDNQFQRGRIDAGLQNAIATNNEAGTKAFQELQQYFSQNPFATPQQVSERYEAALSGRVPRILPNGQTFYVGATNADAEYKTQLDQYNELNALRNQVAQLEADKAQAGIGLTNAQTEQTKNRGQGFDLPQAYSTALRMYGQLSEDQKYDLESQSVTPEAWIKQAAQRLMGDGMGGAVSAGAPSTPFGAMPGAQTVAGSKQQVALTPEVMQGLNREADELQLEGLERRKFAAWRVQNLQANPAEYKPAAPVTPKAEDESKAPPETPAVQLTEEQVRASLDRFEQLTKKPDKTLAEEVELNRLKKNVPEFRRALGKSSQAKFEQAKAEKQLTDRQAKIKQDVLKAQQALASKKYSTGSARKELFGVPQSQEEFDLMMEYASENQGASTYVDDIGLLAQVMGFDVSKWSDKIRVLSPEDLAVAKKALASETP